MHDESTFWSGWKRSLALAGIALAGLVSLVGSGGGAGGFLGSVCDTYPESCAPPLPTVTVTPERPTVQVGNSVTWSAQPSGFENAAYQWQRSADNGSTFVDIPGATASTYTLTGANLADDGILFRVRVHPSGAFSPVAVASSRLAVSATPGVVFQDGDFATAGWQVSVLSVPPNNGATHTEERTASGGHPEAFRRMTHTMPATQQSFGVLNLSVSAVYDPVASGAIRAVDYAEDCAMLSAGNPAFTVYAQMLFEQSGRHYRPRLLGFGYCTSPVWTPLRDTIGLVASDFEILDGPACGTGEACPDFSASGTPIRFGFVRFAQATTTPTVHGIDNWAVTVWRR